MNQQEKYFEAVAQIRKLMLRLIVVFLIMIAVIVHSLLAPDVFVLGNSPHEEPYAWVEEAMDDRIENGIHVRTGFISDTGLMTVVANCTNCHSAKLVTQNRMSKERWRATIRWMQETQNLWDLGDKEAIILEYLASNYAPIQKGRRQNLKKIEWYVLE